MDPLSVTELANKWYRNRQSASSRDPSQNELFEMLYEAYRRRNNISKPYEELSFQDGDHTKACAELYGWYTNRYGTELNMVTGSKGQKRTAGPTEDEYTFDRLYCDNRQFKNYLDTALPQHGSSDLMAFVLHTAVAFLVPLSKLDRVLQNLGFHPLHVKNIHHLAIAYVLLMAENKSVAADFNPFDEVKQLYFKANAILDSSVPPAADAYSYISLETRIIRNMLLMNRELANQNFEDLVARNRDALNMRHSLILSDFHRLSAVFIHIFDSNSLPNSFEYGEENYSFYCFINRFCNPDLSRKKFREHMTSMIDRNQKHPTRNVMILLWLYAYCFSFVPGIYPNDTTIERITKLLEKADPTWADEAQTYYQGGLFDVYGFITGQPQRDIPKTFRGSDFITFINAQLTLRYGWGQLNDKLPFDHYIHNLKNLTFELDYSGNCVKAVCGSHLLPELQLAPDNAPAPLVSVTRIFEGLAEVHAEQAEMHIRQKLSPVPLKCGLYEQL